jgi:hypothetical protein
MIFEVMYFDRLNKFYISNNDDSNDRYLSKDGEICTKMTLEANEYGGTYFDTKEEAEECLRRFNEPKIMTVQAHCSDLCNITFPNGNEHDGYVPSGIGIGGDDDIYLKIDVNTGMIVGWNEEIRKRIMEM